MQAPHPRYGVMLYPNICRCFTLVSFVLIGLNLSTKAHSSDLEYFNKIQKRLDDTEYSESEIDKEIGMHCSGTPIKGCLKYINENSQRVLKTLPDNPEYWRIFHEIIGGEPLELLHSRELHNDPTERRHELLNAARGWIYRAIAQGQTQGMTKNFVAYYKSIRRQMSASTNLLDRLTFGALVGVAHQQIELLMALNAADNNPEAVQALATALSPYTKEERSFRRALEGEQKYINASRVNLDASARQEQLASIQARELEMQQIITAIGDLTEASWSEYWGQESENQLIGSHGAPRENENSFDFTDYVMDHVRTSQSTELWIYSLLALSDMYLDRTTPGLPARTPPPHWRWLWRETSQEICLAPSWVAPESSENTMQYPACVTYLAKIRD